MDELKSILINEISAKRWLYNSRALYLEKIWLSLCDVKKTRKKCCQYFVSTENFYKCHPYDHDVYCYYCNYCPKSDESHIHRGKYGYTLYHVHCSRKNEIASVGDLKRYMQKNYGR